MEEMSGRSQAMVSAGTHPYADLPELPAPLKVIGTASTCRLREPLPVGRRTLGCAITKAGADTTGVAAYSHHSSMFRSCGLAQGAAGNGNGEPGRHRPKRPRILAISASITGSGLPSAETVALRNRSTGRYIWADVKALTVTQYAKGAVRVGSTQTMPPASGPDCMKRTSWLLFMPVQCS